MAYVRQPVPTAAAIDLENIAKNQFGTNHWKKCLAPEGYYIAVEDTAGIGVILNGPHLLFNPLIVKHGENAVILYYKPSGHDHGRGTWRDCNPTGLRKN